MVTLRPGNVADEVATRMSPVGRRTASHPEHSSMNDEHALTSADEARREAAKALQTALDRRDSTSPPENRSPAR
jgi:hypothetical protein